MRSDKELMKLVEKRSHDCLDQLWSELTPEERKKVFRGTDDKMAILSEYISVTF